LAACAADSLTVLHRDHVARAAGAAWARTAVAVLDAEPDLPILVDHWWTAGRLAYYLGYREGSGFFRGADDRARMAPGNVPAGSRLRYLAWYPEPGRLPPGFVVLDDAVLARVARADSTSAGPFFPGEVPAYCYHPPATWRLLRRLGGWRIYLDSPAVAAAGAAARAAPVPGR
jgi:hypothetical protein